MRRVLFVLRGKLGDTIVSYAVVRAYVDRYPKDEVTLMVRANYAALLSGEAGLHVIGFSNRLSLYTRVLAMRALKPQFDALLVLLGGGSSIARVGSLARARRKIFLDRRFADVFTEWPTVPAEHLQFEPAWLAAKVFAPDLPAPVRSSISSLAARRRPGAAVGIVPVADEQRRTFGVEAALRFIGGVAARHPGAPLRVLVNRDDRFAAPLLGRGLPGAADLRCFPTLHALVGELAELSHLYTTDTGLYHLSVAMGVPTTVIYGPTQPWKIGMPEQPDLTRVRLEALGGEHCEEKTCRAPACLEGAAALYLEQQVDLPIGATPVGCPLRRYPSAALGRLAVCASEVHSAE